MKYNTRNARDIANKIMEARTTGEIDILKKKIDDALLDGVLKLTDYNDLKRYIEDRRRIVRN